MLIVRSLIIDRKYNLHYVSLSHNGQSTIVFRNRSMGGARPRPSSNFALKVLFNTKGVDA